MLVWMLVVVAPIALEVVPCRPNLLLAELKEVTDNGVEPRKAWCFRNYLIVSTYAHAPNHVELLSANKTIFSFYAIRSSL